MAYERRNKQITISELTKIRKKSWDLTADYEEDQKIVESNARAIAASKELRRELEKSPHLLIECCFSVVDKRRRNVPFFFNSVQRDFVDKLSTQGRTKPFFILKGRQQGFTTLITAIQLCHALLIKNFAGFTVADRDDNTKAIFLDKAKAMYNSLPQILKPHERFNSVNELYFDRLNSTWRISSASSNIGRSRTLSFIHFSEAAFYKCPLSDLQKSIQESATQDAIIIYETTAKGFNDAKALWDSGACHNLFYQWWKTDEYACDDYYEIKRADDWLSARLSTLESLGLNREQLAWYAKKYNSYMDKSSIRQEYPCTPEEAFVVSGESVFDCGAISNYLSTFKVLSTQGSFIYKRENHVTRTDTGEILSCEKRIVNIEFKPSRDGYISIVEHPYVKVENGKAYKKPYVIGADTAGCGEDYFTAKVIDNTTGRCVATLRKQRMDEDLFAEQLYCLATYYNNAYLAVETNYSRHPIYVLRDLGYENLFRTKYVNNPDKGPYDTPGFVTTAVTRPLIISNLVTVMRESLHLETDRETLKEMTTFIRHPDGRSAAANGSHDDLVMASAICRFAALRYTSEMSIIDTGSDVLQKSFTNQQPETNEIMEW